MYPFILGACIGAIGGIGYAWWAFVQPLADELNARDLIERRQTRQALYASQARREHRGTPYIVPPANELERTLIELSTIDALLGNDDWSKRADLRSVS